MMKNLKKYVAFAMNWLRENPLFTFLIMGFWIIADVYIYPYGRDLRLVYGFVFWYLATRRTKGSSTMTFRAALAVFCLMVVSYIVKGTAAQTERLAVWVYLLVLFGVIRQWFALRS